MTLERLPELTELCARFRGLRESRARIQEWSKFSEEVDAAVARSRGRERLVAAVELEVLEPLQAAVRSVMEQMRSDITREIPAAVPPTGST